jgi:hypothetical protein
MLSNVVRVVSTTDALALYVSNGWLWQYLCPALGGH